jgi:DNA-binding NtrC family response regulator
MPTLLIVDDEANIRSSLAGALGREGFQVATAGALASARVELREAFACPTAAASICSPSSWPRRPTPS